LLLEVHVLDFSGDLYGQSVSVRFRAHVREQATFASLDDLVAQMHLDVARCREVLV
jgi:riboflavin kinase/FMN adenylyltransferase